MHRFPNVPVRVHGTLHWDVLRLYADVLDGLRAASGRTAVEGGLTVKRGERVVWTNKDLVPHTATAAKVFDSRSVAPNASWSYVARKPGRYDYVCTLHPTMKATLVVE